MIPKKMFQKFQKKLVKEAYGAAGTGFLADTIGFTKVSKHQRQYVVYINYVTTQNIKAKVKT